MQPQYQVGFLKDLMIPCGHPWFYCAQMFESVGEARAYIATCKNPDRPYRIIEINVVEQVGVDEPATTIKYKQ